MTAEDFTTATAQDRHDTDAILDAVRAFMYPNEDDEFRRLIAGPCALYERTTREVTDWYACYCTDDQHANPLLRDKHADEADARIAVENARGGFIGHALSRTTTVCTGPWRVA